MDSELSALEKDVLEKFRNKAVSEPFRTSGLGLWVQGFRV